MSIFETIANVLEAETGERVTPETKLATLVTDSLEIASMILELEDALSIEIPDEDICRLFTVRDVVTYAMGARA